MLATLFYSEKSRTKKKWLKINFDSVHRFLSWNSVTEIKTFFHPSKEFDRSHGVCIYIWQQYLGVTFYISADRLRHRNRRQTRQPGDENVSLCIPSLKSVSHPKESNGKFLYGDEKVMYTPTIYRFQNGSSTNLHHVALPVYT